MQRVTDTPGVEELHWGGGLQSDPRGRRSARYGRMRAGRGRKLPSHPRQLGDRQHQPRRGDGERAGSGGAAESAAGNGRGIESRGEHAEASQQRQALAQRASAL